MATRLLLREEIEDHMLFMEEEVDDPDQKYSYLRFFQEPDAELIRRATGDMDVAKLKRKSARLLEQYAAQGYVEVPVLALPPCPESYGRVSAARVARLRAFMGGGFRPIPERVIRASFFSDAEREVFRKLNRVCTNAEANLKAHVANALEEYDAKGYLECSADGKIKVSVPRPRRSSS